MDRAASREAPRSGAIEHSVRIPRPQPSAHGVATARDWPTPNPAVGPRTLGSKSGVLRRARCPRGRPNKAEVVAVMGATLGTAAAPRLRVFESAGGDAVPSREDAPPAVRLVQLHHALSPAAAGQRVRGGR